MTLVHSDARVALSDLASALSGPAAKSAFVPDVVYLDPMYPPKKGRDALPRKEMQALRCVWHGAEKAMYLTARAGPSPARTATRPSCCGSRCGWRVGV
jgi:hypothetical protein